MRTMEFTIENLAAFEVGKELGVSEGVLPSAYYYMLEDALGMSGNSTLPCWSSTSKGLGK